METFRNKVLRLERENDGQKQLRILQEIGALLLNEYEIRIGDMTIEPLLVEAYYYHPEKWRDFSVHAAKDSKAPTYALARQRQENHLGELYVHYGTNDGIDVVLSQGRGYDLSFLIKNALVRKNALSHGEWATQCAVSEKLCENCEQRRACSKGMRCRYYGEIVLRKRDQPSGSRIIYVPRKGISGAFARLPLAALPLDRILDYDFTLPNGYQKQWRAAVYALAKEDLDEERACALVNAKKMFKSQIREHYWALAKQALEGRLEWT